MAAELEAADGEEDGAAADVEDHDESDDPLGQGGEAEEDTEAANNGAGRRREGPEEAKAEANRLRVQLAASRRESDALRAELRALQAAQTPGGTGVCSPHSVHGGDCNFAMHHSLGGLEPTPKCNGTPLPLASPIDEGCCRTPLEPTSRPSSLSRNGGGTGVPSLSLSPLSRTPQTAGSAESMPASDAPVSASPAVMNAATAQMTAEEADEELDEIVE